MNSLLLRIVLITGLVVCNARFYLLSSLFNKKYNEKVTILLDEYKGLYVSKVESNSSLLGPKNYFRVYKSLYPFSKTIKMIHASEVKLIYYDTTSYVLKCLGKQGVDTVFIPF